MLTSISHILNQLKISHFILLIAFLVIFTMTIGPLLSTTNMRSEVLEAEHQTLASHVSTLAKALETTQKQEQSQQLQSLKDIIYPTRWNNDDSGYAFLADGATGRYIVYPPTPAKEGKKMVNIKLIEGGTLEQAIIRSSRRGSAEMIHYPHSQPGSDKIHLKAAYLYPLRQGGDVLIAGTYLNKSDLLQLKLYKKIVLPVIASTIFVQFFIFIFSRYINYRENYFSTTMRGRTKDDLYEMDYLAGRNETAFLADALNITQVSLSRVLKPQHDDDINISKDSLQFNSKHNHKKH
ncbi:cache domain-containing protein [Psychromonas ossibalaenae]|uniref:cache domain-containing protein n=1 Tax=Psychromonas ossibalaenae TaxID=444922 RepID=UPI00035E7936|nr:cache domain-containing protein [Psychromonas ossibalaenae]